MEMANTVVDIKDVEVENGKQSTLEERVSLLEEQVVLLHQKVKDRHEDEESSPEVRSLGSILKWGNYTAAIVLLFFYIPVSFVIAAFYYGLGDESFHKYYYPMFGYYIVIAIASSHYFPAKKTMNYTGFVRIPIFAACGIGLFYFHEMLLLYVWGVDKARTLVGHFVFIVLAFFLQGFDDTFFLGSLSKWIPQRFAPLRSVFWYFVDWAAWIVLFLTPVGADAWSDDNYSLPNAMFILASLQWLIMGELMVSMHWKEYVDKIYKHNGPILRGCTAFLGCLLSGILVACVLYTVNDAAWPNEKRADKWHHVLFQGTFPLHPIVLLGLFTYRLDDKLKIFPTLLSRSIARSLIVVVGAILSYFVYHLIYVQTRVVGDHEWIHGHDIMVNFTLAVAVLQHHWFCGRLWFLRE